MDNSRGHTRSFSSEKLFQDYHAQQVRSTQASSGPSSNGSRAPEVTAAVTSTPAVTAAATTVQQPISKPPNMSSLDEELPDDAPAVTGQVTTSDPLGVS